MRTEIWRDCRNVKGGWRCVTEYGEELFVQYAPDYAERLQTGPARMPVPERGDHHYIRRFPDGRMAPEGAGERVEVIIERRQTAAPTPTPPERRAI